MRVRDQLFAYAARRQTRHAIPINTALALWAWSAWAFLWGAVAAVAVYATLTFWTVAPGTWRACLARPFNAAFPLGAWIVRAAGRRACNTVPVHATLVLAARRFWAGDRRASSASAVYATLLCGARADAGKRPPRNLCANFARGQDAAFRLATTSVRRSATGVAAAGPRRGAILAAAFATTHLALLKTNARENASQVP